MRRLGWTLSLSLSLSLSACDKSVEPGGRDRSDEALVKSSAALPAPPAVAVEASETKAPHVAAPAPALALVDIAGEGFVVGPPPTLTPLEGAEPESVTKSLRRGAVSFTVNAHAEAGAEFEYKAAMQVRVEIGGVGLNYVGGGGEDYCDELLADVMEVAVLADGRWLVDAQLTCRAGEDYFSATSHHALVLINSDAPRVELVWTGADSGEEAMGVCSTARVHGFRVSGDELIIIKAEGTTLDEEMAKITPEGAEGCTPKAKVTTEVARIRLPPAGPTAPPR